MERKLFKGAILLTISSFIVKLLSFIYKIPYQNLVGNEGFYVFQQLYPFFTITTSAAVFSFPYVISNQINRTNNKALILKTGFVITFFPTILLSVATLIFKNQLAAILGDPLLNRLFYPYMILLLLIPFLIVYRANLYASANTNHVVGKSVVIEQFFRVFFILGVIMWIAEDVYKIGELAMYGFIIGVIASLTYLVLKTRDINMFLRKNIGYDKAIAKTIFIKAVILLTCTSILLLFQIIDSLTIINTLTLSGESLESARIIKGIYDRGLPIIQTAVFFVSPILAAFLPHANDRDKTYTSFLNGVIYIILYLAIPATIGAFLYMEQINQSLFTDNKLENVLKLNSVNILLYSLVLATSTVIEHKNKHRLLFLNILAVILIKFILNITLILNFGIIGAVVASTIGLSILLLSNSYILRKEIQLSMPILMKIGLANALMTTSLLLVKVNIKYPLVTRTNHINYLLLSVLFGVTTYFILSLLLKLHRDYKPIK